jgi:hypothetical protein
VTTRICKSQELETVYEIIMKKSVKISRTGDSIWNDNEIFKAQEHVPEVLEWLWSNFERHYFAFLVEDYLIYLVRILGNEEYKKMIYSSLTNNIYPNKSPRKVFIRKIWININFVSYHLWLMYKPLLNLPILTCKIQEHYTYLSTLSI